jgi:hypothetical protein
MIKTDRSESIEAISQYRVEGLRKLQPRYPLYKQRHETGTYQKQVYSAHEVKVLRFHESGTGLR